MHIVFKIFPAHSHLNATFKFALSLKAKNYRVTYVGIKDFEKDVLMQGFEYFIDEDVFPHMPPSSIKPSLYDKLKAKKELKQFNTTYLKGNGFDNFVKNLCPDLIVIDSPYTRHSIPLFNRGIPFVIFESMVILNKAPLHPPLSSKIIVSNSWFNKFLVQLSWKKFFLKSNVEQKLFGTMLPAKHLVKKLSKTTKFPFSEIDFDRYFHIGLNNMPEIIASPREFDFPYEKRNNQYYIGTSVNMNRKEASYDFKYIEASKHIEKLLLHNKTCNATEKVTLIYCSFGSMAWRYEGVNEFYQKLINTFKNDKNIQLFISIGYELSYHHMKNLPENIHVFRKVPQMDLLKKIDLMITHGGMNTITECILSEVPMLVYPGNNKIDQVGNACRVEYHKMGLMGDLKKDSEKLLKKKVHTLLSNTYFKDNILKMKNGILQNDGLTEVLVLIDQLLYENKESNIANPIQ